jgi:hypothetical protein
MVLDHNLFTLRIQPRLDHPGWAELIQQGTVITDPCYRVFLVRRSLPSPLPR